MLPWRTDVERGRAARSPDFVHLRGNPAVAPVTRNVDPLVNGGAVGASLSALFIETAHLGSCCSAHSRATCKSLLDGLSWLRRAAVRGHVIEWGDTCDIVRRL
jgi:hypothetical protein